MDIDAKKIEELRGLLDDFNSAVGMPESEKCWTVLAVATLPYLEGLFEIARRHLATLSLAGEDARPEDRAEQFIQAAVDSAPEPLRRLGEWLANKLDDDDWKTAERLLNGASVEARSLSLRVEAEKRTREEAALERREEELREDARLGAALARTEATKTHSAALARALKTLIAYCDGGIADGYPHSPTLPSALAAARSLLAPKEDTANG